MFKSAPKEVARRVSSRTKWLAFGGAGVVVVALAAFFVLTGKAGDLPIPGLSDDPAVCPLTGEEPAREAVLDRPAVALKIENAAVARPLSGLEKADLVYEELVEGGETRFMAFFHCNDARKAGPIRSARLIDPAILKPKTMILGYSGGNQTVIDAVDEAGVVSVTENTAGNAMQRVERPGISLEHTLYANSVKVRKVGMKQYEDPPPDDLFSFGELEGRSKKASTITLNFGGASTITYEWNGSAWDRFQDGEPFVAETGAQIAPTNVLVEVHRVKASEVVDVAGTPSIEIVDETGSGRAVLFRDGRIIRGRWTRDSVDDAVVFETKAGDEMVLAPGSIWIELVPSPNGEVKGSFSHEK
jgi:Protein of unknown function (DUF3048) N-terminal domain/Protein of unknown function (DUF3048) C-terminal domain